jgi:hypothetical protein
MKHEEIIFCIKQKCHQFKSVTNVDSLKVPGGYERCLQISSSVKGKCLSTPPSSREWATSQTANVQVDRTNPGITIHPLPSVNSLLRGQWNYLSLGWGISLEGIRATSWHAVWRRGKETGILPHYFPWNYLKFYMKKEEHKWTP